MQEKFRSRAIRRQILKILHVAAQTGHTESGSWLNMLTLREVLDNEGCRLTDLELRRHCVYLTDPEIACIEIQKLGKPGQPEIYRYRIRARGMRLLEGEEKIPGIADD